MACGANDGGGEEGGAGEAVRLAEETEEEGGFAAADCESRELVLSLWQSGGRDAPGPRMMLRCPTGKLRVRSLMRKVVGSVLASCSSDQVKQPSTKPTTGSEAVEGARRTEYLAVSCSLRNSSIRFRETWAWRTLTSTREMEIRLAKEGRKARRTVGEALEWSSKNVEEGESGEGRLGGEVSMEDCDGRGDRQRLFTAGPSVYSLPFVWKAKVATCPKASA